MNAWVQHQVEFLFEKDSTSPYVGKLIWQIPDPSTPQTTDSGSVEDFLSWGPLSQKQSEEGNTSHDMELQNLKKLLRSGSVSVWRKDLNVWLFSCYYYRFVGWWGTGFTGWWLGGGGGRECITSRWATRAEVIGVSSEDNSSQLSTSHFRFMQRSHYLWVKICFFLYRLF